MLGFRVMVTVWIASSTAARDGSCRTAWPSQDIGMAVVVFVSQDPAVDQAWQIGPGAEPIDRVSRAAQAMKRAFASRSGRYLKTARSQMLAEALPKGRVGIG